MPKVTALRVLVVDDDPDVAASTALILKYFGYEVVVARDGPRALEAFQAQEPDAVLLDIRMPRMNGCEIARRIGELNQRKPRLIGMSGFGGAELKERCAAAGIDILLQKPVDPEYLALVLQAMLPPAQLDPKVAMP
jgi:CheY-like chemotaxis protein